MSPTNGYLTAYLGAYQAQVDTAVQEMTEARMVARLWERDPTLWPPAPADLRPDVGWVPRVSALRDESDRWQQWVRDVRAEGYTQALVLGMGGASLAATLVRHLFGAESSALSLAVLDSTAPGVVSAYTQWCELAPTVFVVSSPVGPPVETLALCNHFYNHVAATPRAQEVGRHFVAITAPQSPLADLATRLHFRETFRVEPPAGGSAAALSPVGLVPAALVGVDLPRWLGHAEQMQHACGVAGAVDANPGAQLGAILSALARAGRDKVTVRTSATLSAVGAWVEHLLAAHTGTAGPGLIPIVAEPLGLPAAYGPDRLFVYLRFRGDDEPQQAEVLDALAAGGHPVVHLPVQDLYEVGGQVVLWQVATALAGARLGGQPLEHPQVEAVTQRTNHVLTAYRATGAFPEAPPTATFDAGGLSGTSSAGSPQEAVLALLAQGRPGDYVTIQAYLPPPLEIPQTGQDTPELTRLRQEATEIRSTLVSMCGRIRDKYGLAATFGYGPRALYTTGALHTGGAGHGLLLQLTAEAPHEVPIPTEAGALTTDLSFGTLQAAQALGEYQALREAGRRIVRVHLGADVVERLRHLNQALV